MLSAAMLLIAACGKETADQGKASIELKPATLTFEAVGNSAQTVSVTATGTDWEPAVTAAAAEWLTAERTDGNTLTITVQDNPLQEQRTGAVSIQPVGNGKARAKELTVIQKAFENAEPYALTIDPASLTFAAEEAPAQEVTVTVSGAGLTWSATMADEAEGWITVSESDGGFTVSVADNPSETERTGDITVTPSKEAAGTKVVRVVQEAKVFPPSCSIELDNGAAPEEGYVFNYLGRTYNRRIDVHAVNCEWTARVEFDSAAQDWITLVKTTDEQGKPFIAFSNGKANESPEPRTARIVIATDAEGIGPFEVMLLQQGKPDYDSTLDEDVDFGTLVHNEVNVYANNEWRQNATTQWEMKFWSDGIELYLGYKFQGTGDRLALKITTEAIEANSDNHYELPEGTYTVTANFDDIPLETLEPYRISGGKLGYSHPNFPSGSWFLQMENNAYTGEACISEGTMTVSRNGEEYEISFDFTSDALYTVKGSFKGTLNMKTVS